jgi:hypothetical protein
VQHVKGAARRCNDYILFGLAAARQEAGPERRPHRPNVLSVASEVVASIVTAYTEAALDMARDDGAAKRRTLDDVH